jgi:hypothetical protein
VRLLLHVDSRKLQFCSHRCHYLSIFCCQFHWSGRECHHIRHCSRNGRYKEALWKIR